VKVAVEAKDGPKSALTPEPDAAGAESRTKSHAGNSPGLAGRSGQPGSSSGSKTTKTGKSAKTIQAAEVADPVERRVKLRKKTREEIEVRQPRNAQGEMIDPYTREPLRSGEIDVGHKRGQEWRKRKEMHRGRGSTREEVIEAENDSELYHLEDRSSNRSHEHEEK
jgi:hypothetical protein